ncbi:MAG: hypothetical protein EAX95_05050 [Candidatus Thorarchaeota archaeon]|nr:hypothetical protein [Candidatus Thorarchaeota archaeon]
MSYRHKKSAFAAGPREALGNIVKLELISYDLADGSKVRKESTSREKKRDEEETNTLPEDTEETFATEDSEIALPPIHDIETDLYDRYVPAQELQFEVEEVKEVFEKKKKRRNYVEFRVDYGRL